MELNTGAKTGAETSRESESKRELNKDPKIEKAPEVKKEGLIQALAIRMTPTEIRTRTFERAFRGYSTTEVKDFLTVVANCWERMQKQEREFLVTIHALNQELEGWKSRESELNRIRENALIEATALREQAQTDSARKFAEAESRANAIRAQVEGWLESVIEKVEQTQRQRSSFITAFQSALDSHYEILKKDQAEVPPLSQELSDLLRQRASGHT